MAERVIWEGDLMEGLARFNEVMNVRLEALSHYLAESMESYAKTNAPWTDRTGNARNGLKGEAIVVPFKEYGATLAHGVPYGIWLEVRWAGRYAIIGPTLQAKTPEAAALIRRLI